MKPIEVSASRVNETRHRVVLSEEQMKTILVEAVAKAAGVSLDDASVRVEQCCFTSRDRSNGVEREALCVIVVDHHAAAAAEAPER